MILFKLVKSKEEVFFNTKVKMYPNGTDMLVTSSKPVYKAKGYELHDNSISNRPTSYDTESESRANNMHASRNKLYDIAYMNNFQLFVTLTFDKEKIDRYNREEIKPKFKIWLKNGVARKNLKYLFIPEEHKDGAIHLHGLVSGDLKLVDSGKRTTDGKIIYNLPEWKYGFSTAIEITGNIDYTARYITKYITKDCKKIFGNYYYAGGDIVRDVPTRLENRDYDAIDAKEYPVEEANASFKYYSEDSKLLELARTIENLI